MKYENPDIESSLREHDLGRVLYDFVLREKPHTILEFGTLHGYSAICMAMALHRLGRGKVISYDLYDKYPHKHGELAANKITAELYGLGEYVEFREGDLFSIPLGHYDMVFLDVSNDGDIIKKARERFTKTLLFEGGTKERDGIEWMQKYGRTPIQGSIPYKILSDKFPSISQAL
jgi:predicted O-methyltransferase YrrM